MRLEFIGKTKGKVTKVGGFTIKLGQRDTLPAAQLRVMATCPNSILDKFSPGLREFLFEKAKGSDKVQKTLEGVEVVDPELPNLREPGVKLGALHWGDEQTGCTFKVDRAIEPIVVNDCKLTKPKIAPKDGGSVQVYFTLTTGEIDRETAGELLLLNKTDILFELTAPVVQQRDIEDGDDNGEQTDGGLTPEDALGQALQQHHEGKAVTVKPPARKTPAAKKSRRAGNPLTPIAALKKADRKSRGKSAS